MSAEGRENRDYIRAPSYYDENLIVPVPWPTVLKLSMRFHRMKRLRALGAPQIILDEEQKLIDRGLHDLLDYSMVQGLVIEDEYPVWEEEDFEDEVSQG